MTYRTLVLVLTLAASAASAQSVKTPINLASGAANAVSQKAQEVNRQLEGTQQSAARQPEATASATSGTRKRAVNRTAKNEAVKAALANTEQQPGTGTQTPARKNKRDPFISIIRSEGSPSAGPACASGKKCLMVSQIVLRGIVRSPSANIAVVENSARRTYFLRESDPVYNGEVVRITSDSVIFRERSYDRAGRQTSREVVRTVSPGSFVPEGFSSKRRVAATAVKTVPSPPANADSTTQVSEKVD